MSQIRTRAVTRLISTCVVVTCYLTGVEAAMAQANQGRPPATPSGAQQPSAPAQSVVPTGLVTACATFDYKAATGARNMGMRVLPSGQQLVLQVEGSGIVVRADYPSPNVPSTNAAAMFDLLREAWTANRAVTLAISPQGQLTSVSVQLGGASQC